MMFRVSDPNIRLFAVQNKIENTILVYPAPSAGRRRFSPSSLRMPRWFPGLEKACRRRFKCHADMQVQSRCCCRVAPRERGGLVALFNLLLGCISPGGVGTGLYSLLLLTFIAAFLGALMIGRTP
jgi:hypothetical protein